jgi:SAM-dependent methyltransferase
VSQKEQHSEDKAWYERWFGREYLELYAHRNEAEAEKDIDAAEKLLDLISHQPILDLACGAGRHSIELARRGYTVTGIDLSRELLEQAESKAAELNLKIDFQRHDMRKLPFREEFGALLNMFTSFGYFEDDRENGRIMHSIAKALKPDGVFLIDYINRESVLARLVPEDEKRINDKQVKQIRRFNRDTQRLEKMITISDDHGQREFKESVRLYSREEMIRLAAEAELLIDQCLGTLKGDPFDHNSPRLILLGRKP